MLRFRPQNLPLRFIVKERLQTGRTNNYNWQSRINWVPAGLTTNRVGILRRWQQIHHHAKHSYNTIPYWNSAEKMFNKKFLAEGGKASVRFLNTYTAYNWL
jgi:hypothetical protein